MSYILYGFCNGWDAEWEELRGLDEQYVMLQTQREGVYALYSEMGEEYTEDQIAQKSENVDWLTDKATSFMEIMMNFSKNHIIVPMKFLTLFSSVEKIQQILEEQRAYCQEVFEKLQGKTEYSVKIYYTPKVCKEKLMGDVITEFEKSIATKPKGAAFFLRKKFDGELDDKVYQKVCKEVQGMIQTLEPFCTELQKNKLLAKEITGVQAPMIYNGALLIQSDKIEKIQEKIHKWNNEFSPLGMEGTISGPWPPYSFV